MPKPPTVFLGEMTSPEVERFLARSRHRHRAGRLDRAARPARPAADRRARPDRGRTSRGAGRRRGRRPDDQLRPVVPAHRLHRARPRPDPDLHGLRRGRGRRPGRNRLPPDRVAQRPLRQHLCAGVRVRERRGPAAGRHARVPDQLLGRHHRRRGGRVLRGDERPPRQPRRDLGRARDQPGAGRHGRSERRDAAVPRGRATRPPCTPRSSSRPRARSTARPSRERGAMRARRRPSSASATWRP